MKKKKLRMLAVALVLAVTCYWGYMKAFWPSTFLDFPEILANLYAKELCTCRYVIGQSESRCMENHSIVMPPTSLMYDDAAKSVHVRVLWKTSDAKLVSERYGCLRF